MSTVRAPRRIEITAQQRLRTLMRDYFLDLDAASKAPDRRVAWCTSVGPCEILVALGFDVYFPENHGALLGARRMSHELIPWSVGAGYCAESCSYTNSDIGAALSERSPLKEIYGIDGPPKPDLLVYNTNQCREVQDWFSFFGRRHEVMVDGVCPPTHLSEVTPRDVAYVRSQLVELIRRIESHFGLKLDESRLEEAVARSSDASSRWFDVLETARHRRAPLTFWDGLILMAPVILMRGSTAAVHFYDELLAEMNQRIAEGVAAVPDERWRIYWEGMPIWPRMRELSEKLFDLRAAVVASTYCNSWAFEPYGRRPAASPGTHAAGTAPLTPSPYDGGDPLEWMARTSISIFINRDEAWKERFLLDMFERFDVDGAIFHNARTCPNNTNTRFGMPQRIRDRLGMPVLVLDGDLSDLRFFSTAQSMTNLEAFVEQLEGRSS